MLGLGLMGSGIAQTLAAGGMAVKAVESNAAAIERGMGMIRSSLVTINARGVKKGTLTQEQADKNVADVLARIETSVDRQSLADVDLVIEAVPEVMSIKAEVYKDLNRICKKDAILASNTSGLSIEELTKYSERPKTTVGLHYFNPVPIMALVEIVKLDSTDPDALKEVERVVRLQGKSPVVARNTPGFIVNRLLIPYICQAFKLVEDGVATFQDVDVGMKLGAGHPMGPFQLADYVGLDTLLNVMKSWTQDYPNEPAFFIPKMLEDKVKEGKLGRKTGEGFFKWEGNNIAK